MNEARQYLLTLICTSIIAALAVRITEGKGITSSATKLVCGLFLVINLIYPFVRFNLPDYQNIISNIKKQSAQISDEGKNAAAETMSDIIKEKLQAYILDKAASIDVALNVQVVMNKSDLTMPESIIISGNISPYQKSRISQIINDELGIPKEKQQWN